MTPDPASNGQPHRRPPLAGLPRPLRHLVVRPRLALAIVLFVALVAALPFLVTWRWPTILLVAWNVAAGTHLVSLAAMMAGSDDRATLHRARLLDEGALAILGLSTVAGLAGLLAVLAELAVVKDLTGFARWSHVALAGLTVFTSWAFIHAMYAVHYAHRSEEHTSELQSH